MLFYKKPRAMKRFKILFIFIIFILSTAYTQSDYEKYRAEKEKREHSTLYESSEVQIDTVYLVDTVYLESELEIMNNYYYTERINRFHRPYRPSFYISWPWYDDWYWYDSWYYPSYYYGYSSWGHYPYRNYWHHNWHWNRPTYYYSYNSYRYQDYKRTAYNQRKTTYGRRESRSSYSYNRNTTKRKAVITSAGTTKTTPISTGNRSRTRKPISEREYLTDKTYDKNSRGPSYIKPRTYTKPSYNNTSRSSYPSTTRARTYSSENNTYTKNYSTKNSRSYTSSKSSS